VTIEEEIALLRAQVRELQDRQDILDCLVRETRGRDRFDTELTANCYWEDAAIEYGHTILTGADYPAEANAGHRASFAANCHAIASHSCTVDGDVANCESYVIGGLLARDEATCIVGFFRYLDRLERRDGVWKIKARRGTVDVAAEGDASWLRTLGKVGMLRGERSRDDASYKPFSPGIGGQLW
jgi:hypothetical protein